MLPPGPLIAAALRRLLGARLPRTIPVSDAEMYVLVPRSTHTSVDLDSTNRFLESEQTRAYRAQIALELLDEDVFGFVLLMLKKRSSDADPRPEVAFRSQTEPEWREAFVAAIGQVALALVD